MISRLGSWLARIFQHTCPDPFVIAILFSIITVGLALALGDFPKASPGQPRWLALFDAWRADSGLWTFLSFGMQMSLVLVTGHVLSAAPLVRRMLAAIARRPRTPREAVALVGLLACVTGVINWGLGLIVGAVLARDVGRAMHARGVRVHYPLLVAAGYMGLMVFHGGLSGSAPLSMTTPAGAARVLPPAYIEQIGNRGIGLDQTTFGWMNWFITGGMVLLTPIVLMLLTPRDPAEVRTMADIPEAAQRMKRDAPAPRGAGGSAAAATLPERMDRSPILAWLLALPLALAVVRYLWVRGAGGDADTLDVLIRGLNSLGLNEIIALMFALGLVLHGSPRAYMQAAEDGARDCAGIIVQFPIYGGITAMMDVSGLVGLIARGFAAWGTVTTLPLLTFAASCLIALFVPSGGAQWGIQGPIAIESAIRAGVPDIGKMVMSVAYGDELVNMLQPFWALPLLSITGVRARDIIGYTCVVMLFGIAWTVLGLLVF